MNETQVGWQRHTDVDRLGGNCLDEVGELGGALHAAQAYNEL